MCALRSACAVPLAVAAGVTRRPPPSSALLLIASTSTLHISNPHCPLLCAIPSGQPLSSPSEAPLQLVIYSMQQHPNTRVGVLALQGSFREHMALLRRIPGVEPVEVRTKEELDSVAGLIIPGEQGVVVAPPPLPPPAAGRQAATRAHLLRLPTAGGESTTMALVAERWGLIPELQRFAADTQRRRPMWGTCAGLIFLADRASGARSAVHVHSWAVGASRCGVCCIVQYGVAVAEAGEEGQRLWPALSRTPAAAPRNKPTTPPHPPITPKQPTPASPPPPAASPAVATAKLQAPRRAARRCWGAWT